MPGGTLEYAFSNPHWDILRAARAARAQNGLVSVAHFENLPGAATPVAVALGLLDALELPTWSDPMQLPAHLVPWDNSGMSTAEFTPMRGVDLYYQYLNAGFQLPIAAGTDKIGRGDPRRQQSHLRRRRRARPASPPGWPGSSRAPVSSPTGRSSSSTSMATAPER